MSFELDNYSRNVPDEELLDDVKRVSIDINKSPTLDEYNERGKYHSTTLTRRFGSWLKILERLNLKPTRSPLNISNEELFINIEEIWASLGRQPRYEDVLKPLSKYSVGTYEKRFGTWRKALEAFVNYVNNGSESELTFETEKKSAVSTHKTKRTINWRLRFTVFKRDNFKCKICGRSPATDASIILHVDHIKPWSKGGETIEENLQSLCSRCNIGKSDIE